MSLDAVAVSLLSNSELDCIGLVATAVSYDAVASESAWFAWYSVSEEPESFLFGSVCEYLAECEGNCHASSPTEPECTYTHDISAWI